MKFAKMFGVISILMLVFATTSMAAIDVTLEVSPTDILVGDSFTLVVKASGPETVGAHTLKFYFDTNLITYNAAGSTIDIGTLSANPSGDPNTEGFFTLDYFSLVGPPAGGYVPGSSATIALLSFTAKSPGNEDFESSDTVAEPNIYEVTEEGTLNDILNAPPTLPTVNISSGADSTPPDITEVLVNSAASGLTVDADTPINLTASATDADSNIARIEYFIGSTDPGKGNATPMIPDDGGFDSSTEAATADITSELVDLGEGTYTITVRAIDSSANANADTDQFTVTLEAGIPAKLLFDVSSRTISTDGSDSITVTGTVVDDNNIPVGDASPGGDVTFTLTNDEYATLPDGGDGFLTETVSLTDGETAPVTIQSKDVDPPDPATFRIQASAELDGPINLDGFDAQNTANDYIEINATDRTLLSIEISPQTPDAKIGGGDIQFTATGTFDTGDPEDVTESVDWSITAGGAYGSISNAPGTKGLFTPTAPTPQGEVVTVQADPGIAGEEKTVSFTVAPADPISFFNNCTNPPTIRPNDNYDFVAEGAVSGGIPDYTFEILTGPETGPISGGVFSPTLAGNYEIQVSDSQSDPDTETAVCTISVPLVLNPTSFTINSANQDTQFKVYGAPAGASFTKVTTPADAGTIGDGDYDAVTGVWTFDYTPPQQEVEFDVEFTDTESGLSVPGGPYKVFVSQAFNGVVTEAGTDPVETVESATVVLTNTGEQTLSDPNGEFSFDALVSTGQTYTIFVSKDGYYSAVRDFTTWDPATPEEFALTPVGDEDVVLSGSIILEGATAPYSGQAIEVTVSGDGGFNRVVYANQLGQYSAVIPQGNTGETFTITAEKNGYFFDDPTSGITKDITLGDPAENTTADVTLKPITKIAFDKGYFAPEVDLILTSAIPAFPFDGDSEELSVTDSSGNPVTFAFDDLIVDGYSTTLNPAPTTLFLEIQAETTDDHDISTEPADANAVRSLCVIPQADSKSGSVVDPTAQGGIVETDSGSTIVDIPVAGIQGVDRYIYRVSVDIEEVDASVLGELFAGGEVVSQISIINGNGKPLPEDEINGFKVSLKYNEAELDPSDLTSGLARVYRADSACDLDGLTDDIGLDPIPVPDISVAAGMVTFTTTSAGAFAIGKAEDDLAAPMITTLSKVSGVSTGGENLTINGDNLSTVTSVTVQVNSGTPVDVTGDSTIGETIRFPAPSAPQDAQGTVTVCNSENECDSAGFAYQTSGTPQPPPPPPPSGNPPTADFEVEEYEDAEVIEINAGTILQFRNLSSNASSWLWNFGDEESGDDNTSTDREPEHQYNTPGTYDVRLRTSNFNGSSTELKEDYIVVAPLTAAFTVEPEQGDVPVTLTITDTSGNVTNREWTLTGPDGEEEVIGDGAETFSLEIEEPGEYTIALAVENNEFSDTAEQTLTFGGEIQLIADFDFSVDGCVVTFENLSEGPYDVVLWEFGDDGFSEERDPAPFQFARNGAYDVTLAIATADGTVTDSITKTVNVVNCGGEVTVDAGFDPSRTSGVAPLTVRFTDTSTSDPVGIVDTWSWDFNGDGFADSTLQSPSYTFDQPGDYTVTLVIGVSGTAVTDQASQVISVREPDGNGEIVDPPMGQQPQDGAAGIGLNPSLVVGPYNDPENPYGATVWEIATDLSFEEMFVIWRQIKDAGTDEDFTLDIPDFILESGPATYYWRVKFIDAPGLGLVWGGPYIFTPGGADPRR